MNDFLKNKRSDIWNHYTIVENNKKAKCGYCNKIISFTGGATGNLKRHLKSIHKSTSIEKINYEEPEDEFSIDDPGTSSASTGSNNDSQKSSSSSSPSATTSQNLVQASANFPSSSREIKQERITNFLRRPLPVSRVK